MTTPFFTFNVYVSGVFLYPSVKMGPDSNQESHSFDKHGDIYRTCYGVFTGDFLFYLGASKDI